MNLHNCYGRKYLMTLATLSLLTMVVGMAHADPVVISVPDDMVIEATGFFTPANVGMANASSSGKILVAANNAPPVFLVGNTTVTWFAYDGDGGYAIATQTVTVQDTTPPVFSDFPHYAKFISDTGKKVAVDFDWPRATDIADPDVEVTSSHRSGYKFPVGNTTVTFTATDDSGNSMARDVIVIIQDTRPRIQNLVAVPTHNSISVSWDMFGNNSAYRVVLTDIGANTKISSLKTESNSNIFTDLKPDTRYEILVFAIDDRSTKTSMEISTMRAPFTIIDDFSDTSLWTFQRILRTFEIPDAYNNYQLTTDKSQGKPAPSGKISGNGYGAYAQIYREFDLTGLGDDDLFLGLDYKFISDSVSYHENNLYIEVQVLDSTAYRNVLLSGGGSSADWQSFSHNITDFVGNSTSIKVFMYTHDYDPRDWNREVHYDNLYLGSIPPSE